MWREPRLLADQDVGDIFGITKRCQELGVLISFPSLEGEGNCTGIDTLLEEACDGGRHIETDFLKKFLDLGSIQVAGDLLQLS